MAWVRHGECNRCGDCCMTGDPFNGELGVGEVAGVCPLFKWVTENGKQLGACKVKIGEAKKSDHPYIENYTMNGCELWPEAPEQIAGFKNCSYTFEWVD